MIPEPKTPGARPQDVDTGFWLWLAAVPLLLTGYLVDVATAPDRPRSVLIYAITGMCVLVLCAIVVTFLFLMRQGYRWTRTLLTGGGIASVVYVATRLFTLDRPAPAAITFAVTGIVGSVLIAGGVFLLHHRDAHAYFTNRTR